MAPSALSPNVLHVLLQYISPPSQMSHPIPPHLLSKPLLQRHHFLHLTPEHPDDYLCWPSSPEKKARVIDLLETRPRPLDDDQPSIYPVQYSFDGEDFFAHVDLSSHADQGPRLILQWDQSGEWKYHNTDLMPFPPGSRVVLEDVLIPSPPPNPVSLQSLSRPSYPHTFEADGIHDDSDDDDYWNAYGATDIGDSHYGQSVLAAAKDPVSSEDAYWAQYASVHGTADSTIPSPAPRRKPLPAVQQLDGQKMESLLPLPVPVRVPYECEDPYAEPLPIPPGIIARNNTRWDPASPTTLAHLLSTISPRPSPALIPAPDDQFNIDPDLEEELSSPTVGESDDSDLSSEPALGLESTDIEAVTAGRVVDDSLASIRGSVTGTSSAVVAINGTEGDEEEADLRAALEGVWRMWKKTKGQAARLRTTSGDCEAREAFLRNAQLVVDDM